MPAGPSPASIFSNKTASTFAGDALERFQAKWVPVGVKKTRNDKDLEPRSDAIRSEKALAAYVLRKRGAIRGAVVLVRKVESRAYSVHRRQHVDLVEEHGALGDIK
jgi:hypothetical protein